MKSVESFCKKAIEMGIEGAKIIDPGSIVRYKVVPLYLDPRYSLFNRHARIKFGFVFFNVGQGAVEIGRRTVFSWCYNSNDIYSHALRNTVLSLVAIGVKGPYLVLADFEDIPSKGKAAAKVLKYGVGYQVIAAVFQFLFEYIHYTLAKWSGRYFIKRDPYDHSPAITSTTPVELIRLGCCLAD